MRIFFAALMVSFLMSCTVLEKTPGLSTETVEIQGTYNKMYREVPAANYTKYNSRDNIGEFLDDAYFHFEKFAHSIEYQETNGLDILFYPFKKNELRSGSPLIYR